MAAIHTTTHLCLHGDDAPTEVRVDETGALFLSARRGDAVVIVSGYPQDVRDWLNAALGQVDEAMEPLTPCQRTGKHRWEESGMEDGCRDCDLEPVKPVLVTTAPF